MPAPRVPGAAERGEPQRDAGSSAAPTGTLRVSLVASRYWRSSPQQKAGAEKEGARQRRPRRGLRASCIAAVQSPGFTQGCRGFPDSDSPPATARTVTAGAEAAGPPQVL